jgi:hypothetical protein
MENLLMEVTNAGRIEVKSPQRGTSEDLQRIA